jgi:glucose-1-phosphate cytidylyltransferase
VRLAERMDVVILCGGKGERLREYTSTVPKPAVVIGPKPILWHIMMMYAHAGFLNFTLCLGYKGEVIREFFAKEGAVELAREDDSVLFSYGDLTVRLVDTGRDTMTGGRLKRIERWIEGDTFMVTYGDCVSSVDLRALVDFHYRAQRLATVTVVKPAPRFGVLVLDGDAVVSFREKDRDNEPWINGGFFVFNRRIFDYLADDDTLLELDPMARLAAAGELTAFVHDGFWQCMDTLPDALKLRNLWDTGVRPWVGCDCSRAPTCSEELHVHP